MWMVIRIKQIAITFIRLQGNTISIYTFFSDTQQHTLPFFGGDNEKYIINKTFGIRTRTIYTLNIHQTIKRVFENPF